MFESSQEVYLAVILTALLMILLVIIIVIAVIKYQNRYRIHFQEILSLKHNYQEELLKAQLEIKEQTMHTISQEIHDNIGQILSFVKLNLNTLDLANPQVAKEKIGSAKDMIGKAIHDLRDLSKTLNADHIENQFLSTLLQVELSLLQKSGVFNTAFELRGKERNLDPQRHLILFRIFQESVNNSVKHSKADTITAELEYLTDAVMLSITDNGKGFDTRRYLEHRGEPKGTGLGNMLHRAKLIGADLKIESHADKGTSIKLVIPG